MVNDRSLGVVPTVFLNAQNLGNRNSKVANLCTVEHIRLMYVMVIGDSEHCDRFHQAKHKPCLAWRTGNALTANLSYGHTMRAMTISKETFRNRHTASRFSHCPSAIPYQLCIIMESVARYANQL